MGLSTTRYPGRSTSKADNRLTRVPALAWLAAGVAVYAVSVLVYRQLLASNPELWGHTDEFVYRAAGIEVHHHPADLYRALFGEANRTKLQFAYPPIAALVFALFTSFSFGTWQVGLVVINVLLLPVILYASLRISGRRGLTGAALAFALAAMALWLEPVYMTMFFGQINLILLTLGIVDFALPDSCKWKGIGIGLAAGLKLTPLIFIPFLLGSRRIRAGLVSAGTFLATAVIGFIVLPAASHDFWFTDLAGQGRFTLQNQSIDGILERLLPAHPAAGHDLWLAAGVIAAVVGLATAVLASRRGLELLGVVLCAITGLLVSPVSWTHHWVWAVLPGLALMFAGARRRTPEDQDLVAARPRDLTARAVGAVAILVLFGMWPRPHHSGHVTYWLPSGLLRLTPNGYGVEKTWHGWELLTGNYYVILGVLAIAGAAVYLWVTRARTPEAAP